MTRYDPPSSAARIAVVVLAGGEGRRMGGEKPRRPFGQGSLISHAVALARSWSPLIAVAVRDASQVQGETDAPLLFDDPAVPGPAAGLGSALRFARETGAATVLTLPCDAPALPADLLSRLDGALAPDVLAAIASANGVLQPTCGLWRPEAVDHLPAYLAAGRRSLRGFAEICGAAVVDWAFETADPFANANTLDELAALQPPASRR